MNKNTLKKPSKELAANAAELPAAGSEAAYLSFLAAARAIPASQVLSMRTDVHLATHNANIGAASLNGCSSSDLKKLPQTDFTALAQIPTLGLALSFAHDRVVRAPTAALTAPKLARGRDLAHKLVAALDALVAADLVPSKDVEKIHAARTGFDLASQLVSLPGVFRKHAAAIKGKHAVTREQLEEAAKVGSELLLALTPSRAKSNVATGDAKQATLDRDRLWTLLVQRHEQAWRAGAYLFGPAEVDQKVPSLFAHKGGRPPKKSAPSPAPIKA